MTPPAQSSAIAPVAPYMPAMITEHDAKVITSLHQFGLPRTSATVLITLARYANGQLVSSRWIEKVADLRQPEVCMGIKPLIADGIVTEREDSTGPHKGRPIKLYVLARSPLDYIHDKIEARKQEIVNDAAAVYALWPEMGA